MKHVRTACDDGVRWLAGMLVAVAAWTVPARAVSVNVDGLSGAGEWTDASVVISDLNEPGVPDDRDIRTVMIKGGHSLYFAATCYGQSLDIAPLDTNPTLRLGFALGDGQTWRRFELAYGVRQPVSERMRLIAADGGGQDLGAVGHATAETLEIEVPWALLRPQLPAGDTFQMKDFSLAYRAVSGDVTGDGEVNLMDLGTVAAHWGQNVSGPYQGDLTGDGAVDLGDLTVIAVNWGGHPYDVFDEATVVQRDLPVATHAPEPLTMLSALAGLGGLAGYVRRRSA